MRLGIFHGVGGSQLVGDAFVAAVEAAEQAGFASFFVPHMRHGVDALTGLAIAGREVDRIELGTAVVPMWPRHPLALAQQALTTNAVIGGRLSLGVGLGHKPIVEGSWGIPFERAVRYASEYLTALSAALANERLDFDGEILRAHTDPLFEGVPAPPVYVAALGEQMLKVAGTRAEGTVLWMVGPTTIEHHIVPVLRESAERAERPVPMVLVCVPVLCTDDVDAGRAAADRTFAKYSALPSYRAVLDREGYHDAPEAAIVGDEHFVRKQLQQLAAAGATDILCAEFGAPADTARTRTLLASLT